MTDSPTARHAVAPALTRKRGGPLSDFYLRFAGVLGLTGIAVVMMVPQFTDLVVYFALALWFNGPQSAVAPAGFEPVLMLYGQLYAPFLIAAVGTAANVVIEALNYRLFALAAETRSFKKAGDTKVGRWLTRAFGRAPFVAVTVAAAGLPLWIARVLVVLSGYPIARHLTATALGRFPRFFFFAALGDAVGIPPHWLTIIVGSSLIITAVLLSSRYIRGSGTAKVAPIGPEVVPARVE